MEYFGGLTFPNSNFRHGWNGIKDAFPIYYGIQYVYEGPVALRIDRRKWFHAEGPVVFLTCPTYNYEYLTPRNQGRAQYWVCFTGPRAQKYVEGGLFPLDLRNPLLTPRDPEQFLLTMSQLIAASNTPAQYDRAVWLLEGILLELTAVRNEPLTENRYLARLDDLRRRITENPRRQWNFEAEARTLSITINHFNRLFRRFYRDSPRRFLIGCRLRKAARLLAESDLDIADIADAVGVGNAFYFSRLFHKYYLRSPRDYRNGFRFTQVSEPEK